MINSRNWWKQSECVWVKKQTKKVDKHFNCHPTTVVDTMLISLNVKSKFLFSFIFESFTCIEHIYHTVPHEYNKV